VEKFKPFIHTFTDLQFGKHRPKERSAAIVAAGIGRVEPRAIGVGSKKVGAHGFLRIIEGFAGFAVFVTPV
jgi:hypothetical protein